MDKILVSACLIGDKCTYKGGDNAQAYLAELNEFYDLVPFCCEVEGGLSIPRLPSEIRGNAVYDSEGKDVSSYFRNGVYKASSIVSFLDIRIAILNEISPSCGVHRIHDGYFSGRLVEGQGYLARELIRLGVHVMNEEEGKAFLEELKAQKAIKDEKTKAAIEKENAPKEDDSSYRPRRSPARENDSHGKPFRKNGNFGKKKFDDKGHKGGFGKKPFGKKPYEKKDGSHGEKKKDYGVRKSPVFDRTRVRKPKKD